jgi:hypothetical protein
MRDLSDNGCLCTGGVYLQLEFTASLLFAAEKLMCAGTLQRTNTENSKQIFPENQLHSHSPISTFMCLWAIYIFPRSICLFCCRKYVDRSWEYLNRSQTRECGNCDRGRAIPRKGIHKWDFRCSAGNPSACLSFLQFTATPLQSSLAGRPSGPAL